MDHFDEYEKRALRKKIIIGISVVAVILITAGIVFTQFWTNFEVQKITVEPGEAVKGNAVVITAQIENKGSSPGEYTAELKIDGSIVEKKAVTIPAKSKTVVTFAYIPTRTGKYGVGVGQSSTAFNTGEGLLPAWYSGDIWTYRVNIAGEQYESTYDVLGETTYEGVPIYVVRLSSKSQSAPYNRGTSMVNKNTLSVIEEERLGTVDNISVNQKTVSTGSIVEGTRWPLVSGNTWTEHISNTITTKTGFIMSEAKDDTEHTFNVEGMEDITTPAGVFRCFKIVERDEGENVVGTSWYSDKIKREAKYEMVLAGNAYSFDLSTYKVATSPPKIVPKVEVNKFTMYQEPDSGYIVYYQPGWELETKEAGTVQILTTNETGGLKYSSIRIRVVTVAEPSVLDIDEVFKDILTETYKNDPLFVLLDSQKIPAGLPAYQLRWRSKLNSVNTIGKTLLVINGQQLFILTGWVQEKYEKTYAPQLEQIIGSFGIKK